eukprot:scaffold17720_cov129-Isochrysis_galbana.AAC.1
MPAAGAVWPLTLMGAEVSCICISSIQAAERRAGRGSVGRAKGAASNRCVSHVGRQTRVAQATAPCAAAGTTSELGQTAAVSIGCGCTVGGLYFPQKNASFRASAAAPRPAEVVLRLRRCPN